MIHDKNFLTFLERKRWKRRNRKKEILIRRKKILINLPNIRKKNILRNAFIKIHNQALVNAEEQQLRWEYFTIQYKNTTGKKPPFMLKNWFHEPNYI